MKKNNVTIINKWILISSFTALFILGGCSKTIYPSAWQPTPVTVDGSLSDWTLPLPYYDTNTKLNYSITNDDRNLYICMRTSDPQAQAKMLRGGFTIWLDVKGKKNQLTGIRYPLPESLLPDHTPYSSGGGRGGSKRLVQLLAQQKQMELIGFNNTANGGNPNGLTFLRTPEGIAVAANADSTGELVYEATIPFKTFYKETITAADSLKTISIGFVENGLPMQGGHKGASGGGGGGMGGSGGMGGGMGGHGGGMHGGGGGSRGGGGYSGDSSNETEKSWNYIRLSVK